MYRQWRVILDFWRRRSLRFWLAAGMMMAYCPTLIAAIIGYVLYHQAIITPLVEVSSTQRDLLEPLRRMQVSLGDLSESVMDFVIDGLPVRLAAYERHSEELDAGFSEVLAAFESQKAEADPVRNAMEGWRELESVSDDLMYGSSSSVDSVVSGRVVDFQASQARLGRQLATVYDAVRSRNAQTHKEALTDLARAEDLVAVGLLVSIALAALGVLVINRSLVSSMDRVAAGAMRLAAGDRRHRISVQIPRELVSVAHAFNTMATQILQQEKELTKAARTDGLTGLYNRYEFDRMLADEIHRAGRYAGALSLLIGDVDHFKRLNDTHGHQAGDEALRKVARTLASHARAVDKVCRYGGEEFVVILPECDADGALNTAERLRAAVERTDVALVDGTRLTVTLSFGAATYPEDGTSSERLLSSADNALYAAKAGGRNRVCHAQLDDFVQIVGR